MEGGAPVPIEVEAAIKAILEKPPQEAAVSLAFIAHRATAALHGLANREAKTMKGTASWGSWARLVNASRAMVLQATAVRDAAKSLD